MATWHSVRPSDQARIRCYCGRPAAACEHVTWIVAGKPGVSFWYYCGPCARAHGWQSAEPQPAPVNETCTRVCAPATHPTPARTAKYRVFARNTLDTGKFRKDANLYAGWRRFVELCRSLDADGFDFTVRVQPGPDGMLELLVQGSADHARAQKLRPRRVSIIPAKVSPEKCHKEAAAARRKSVRECVNPGRRRMGSWDWIEPKVKGDRQVGRSVARAIARGESTVSVDGILCSVKRLIEERRSLNFSDSHRAEWRPFADGLDARREAYADYLYWRELEALSGQREHWKPGIAEGAMRGDDGIAA